MAKRKPAAKVTLSPDEIDKRLGRAYKSSLACYAQLSSKRIDKKILDKAVLEGESAIGLAPDSKIPWLLREQRDKVGKGAPTCGKIEAKTWVGLSLAIAKLPPEGWYRHKQAIALGVQNLATWAHELVHAADVVATGSCSYIRESQRVMQPMAVQPAGHRQPASAGHLSQYGESLRKIMHGDVLAHLLDLLRAERFPLLTDHP